MLPGTRVKKSFHEFKREFVPIRSEVIHVLAASNKEKDPIGHTFAVMETRRGRRCCVISQMCVKKEHRGRGVATQVCRSLVYSIQGTMPRFRVSFDAPRN